MGSELMEVCRSSLFQQCKWVFVYAGAVWMLQTQTLEEGGYKGTVCGSLINEFL